MNKILSTRVGILIIILVAGVTGASVLLFSQNTEEEIVFEEEAFVEEDELITEEYPESEKEENKEEKGNISIQEKARLFCEGVDLNRIIENYPESFKGKKMKLIESIPVNFSGNINLEKREIVGVCEGGGSKLLFVINENGKILLERAEGVLAQRERTFEDLSVKDINKNGRDEIIYKYSAWSGSSLDIKINIYSSKYGEWFFIGESEMITLGEEINTCSREVTYSDNFTENEISFYKDFFQIKDAEEWSCVDLY